MFDRWARWLTPAIDVLAVEWLTGGPGDRQSFGSHLERLVESWVGTWWACGDRPYALFGHRTGALVAFEIVRILARQGCPTPLHLFISACPPPPPSEWLPDVPDPEMLELLRAADSDRSVGSLDDTVERYFRERQLVWGYRPHSRVEIGVTLLRGVEDLNGGSGRLEDWRRWTTGPVEILSIGGDHFFLFDHQHVVAAALRERIFDAATRLAEVAPVLSLDGSRGGEVLAHRTGGGS